MEGQKIISVLYTGAGAPGMPGVLTCLRQHKDQLRLIGVDMDANAPSRKDFDAFYTVPAAKDEAFIPRVLDICRREQVNIVVPCVTRELQKFACARAEFEAMGVRVAVMEPEKLALANNKGALLTAIRDAGIPTADFYLADNLEQMEKAFELLGYPEKAVCAKAVEGNGSRAVRLVDANISKSRLFFDEKPSGMYISKQELMETLAETEVFPKQMILMQMLPGDEYSVDLVAQKGVTQAVVCRKGMQVVSSNQTSSMIVDEPRVIEQCCRVVELFGLSGNIGFDLKCDEKGIPFILEINPRLTGGIVTCLAAGANMPWLGLCSWLGQPVQQPQLRLGVRMQRFWNERFYDENDNLMEIGG